MSSSTRHRERPWHLRAPRPHPALDGCARKREAAARRGPVAGRAGPRPGARGGSPLRRGHHHPGHLGPVGRRGPERRHARVRALRGAGHRPDPRRPLLHPAPGHGAHRRAVRACHHAVVPRDRRPGDRAPRPTARHPARDRPAKRHRASCRPTAFPGPSRSWVPCSSRSPAARRSSRTWATSAPGPSASRGSRSSILPWC